MITQLNKFTTIAGVAILLLVAATDASFARSNVDLSHPAFATVSSSPTSIPIGHAEFCKTHPAECTINASFVEAEALTEAKWNQLLEINSRINTSVIPVTDDELYQVAEFWTYPNGYGDCEDYALAKRQALMNAGWNASTLLIAVVRQANGEGHAVLMVRTDRGDLVLDNQESLVKVWNDTPYQYLKRQSQFDTAAWVDIYDNRPTVVASR